MVQALSGEWALARDSRAAREPGRRRPELAEDDEPPLRALEPRSPELDTGVGIEFIGGSASQLMALEDYVARGEKPRGDS